MPERRVTAVRIDASGLYVTHLVNELESWSPLSARDAIAEIQLGMHNYYVELAGRKCRITDAGRSSGKYLRADRDATARNNLLDVDLEITTDPDRG